MKNILYYYYGIIVSKMDNDGYFAYQNHLFCLYKIKRNIEEVNALIVLNQFMISNHLKINKIIFNNYLKPITVHDDQFYVLILIKYRFCMDYFSFIEAPLNNQLNILRRNNWAYLWSMKVDYFEKNQKLFKDKYPLINESMDYYIGMAENAISYFKMLQLNNEKLFISHRRVDVNDFYNPLELVLDYKVRDISEYIKKIVFQERKSLLDIKNIINNMELSHIDYLLLFNRLLYPSYYFDMVDEIINDKKEEKEIMLIINLSMTYENMLADIYRFIKRKYPIMEIEWLMI